MNPLPAVTFLTIVPAPGRSRSGLDAVAKALWAFPLIGLGLGAAAVGVHQAASRALPEPATAALVVVALLVLTGGMHLEGLADACDGLFGGRTRDDRLAIMRDPRAGAYGVMGIVSVLGLKWAGVGSLPGAIRFEALILVPCLARAGLALCVAAFPYARERGMGAPFRQAGLARALAACGIAAGASAALLGPGGLAAWALATGGALGLGTWASSRVGGLTGDLYGAVTEVVEAAAFLGLAAAGRRLWLAPLLLG